MKKPEKIDWEWCDTPNYNDAIDAYEKFLPNEDEIEKIIRKYKYPSNAAKVIFKRIKE